MISSYFKIVFFPAYRNSIPQTTHKKIRPCAGLINEEVLWGINLEEPILLIDMNRIPMSPTKLLCNTFNLLFCQLKGLLTFSSKVRLAYSESNFCQVCSDFFAGIFLLNQVVMDNL